MIGEMFSDGCDTGNQTINSLTLIRMCVGQVFILAPVSTVSNNILFCVKGMFSSLKEIGGPTSHTSGVVGLGIKKKKKNNQRAKASIPSVLRISSDSDKAEI